MALHILRKDLILLWPLAALSALVQFGLDGLMFAADRSAEGQYLLLAARLSVVVVFLAIALTVALGVQQDAIVGTRQDWLTRPIRRRDLLLAKLLFVLVAIHLPMLLADLAEAAAHGFSLGEALTAALSRNIFAFVALTLPALAFAAMTRTTAQFIAVGIAYFIAVFAATFLLSAAARLAGEEQATNPLAWTGVAWVPQTLARAALGAGAVVALGLLYFGRRIVLARSLLPVFAALSVLATLSPWRLIFQVQEAAAAPAPALATLAIDPSARRYAPAPGESLDDYAAGAAQVQLRGRAAGDIDVETRIRRAEHEVTAFIPVRILGLPARALPWADRAEVTLSSPDGRVLFNGRGDQLMLQGGVAYEAVRIPGLLYQTVKDQPLYVRIDFSLTELRPGPEARISALGAEASLPGFGRCSTGRDADGDEVELKCVKAGASPSCVSAGLEDPTSGRRNPPIWLCAPNYAPYTLRLFPDALSRFEVEVPFRDRLGVASYPVGGGQLGHARVWIQRYDAVGHSSRSVSASGLRLAALTA